jgi:hypothetical protein
MQQGDFIYGISGQMGYWLAIERGFSKTVAPSHIFINSNIFVNFITLS